MKNYHLEISLKNRNNVFKKIVNDLIQQNSNVNYKNSIEKNITTQIIITIKIQTEIVLIIQTEIVLIIQTEIILIIRLNPIKFI